MSGYLIDLFFSFKGRASRQEWLIGAAVIAAVMIGGVVLFNDGSFDESINASPEIPTMAAVFWVLLGLYAFAALSVKRLNDAGYGRWVGAVLAVSGFVLLCGWGAGYFLAPFSPRPDTFVFWALIVSILPVVLACTRGPEPR